MLAPDFPDFGAPGQSEDPPWCTPSLSARSAAERYVAELVQVCLGIATVFESYPAPGGSLELAALGAPASVDEKAPIRAVPENEEEGEEEGEEDPPEQLTREPSSTAPPHPLAHAVKLAVPSPERGPESSPAFPRGWEKPRSPQSRWPAGPGRVAALFCSSPWGSPAETETARLLRLMSAGQGLSASAAIAQKQRPTQVLANPSFTAPTRGSKRSSTESTQPGTAAKVSSVQGASRPRPPQLVAVKTSVRGSWKSRGSARGSQLVRSPQSPTGPKQGSSDDSSSEESQEVAPSSPSVGRASISPKRMLGLTTMDSLASRARPRRKGKGVPEQKHKEAIDGGTASHDFRELKVGLKGRFEDTKHRMEAEPSGEGDDAEKAVEKWSLYQLAKTVRMSLNDVIMVKEVFSEFDKDGTGTLDVEEFEQAVQTLLEKMNNGSEVSMDRVKSMTEAGMEGSSGGVDFREFLQWYSSNGFNEDLLLDQKQRSLRALAKKHSIEADYVDSIKRVFDHYDQDGSDSVELEEFKHILHKVLKVPQNLELPPSRVQYFWNELDQDGSGGASFEEFLCWWLKYFDEANGKSVKHMPFEDFYRQVRRIGPKYLDPPAYPPRSVEVI